MIIDCFPFLNELDVLEIRLHQMDPWVDRFVLVESEETYSGNPKPLFFDNNINRFEPFLHKIVHLISPTVPPGTDAFSRHGVQRNYAIEALYDCSPDDTILVGDVDEILRGRDYSRVPKGGRNKMVTCIMRNYQFYLNFQRPGGWPATAILTYENLMYRFKGSLYQVKMERRLGNWWGESGWHFANMGGFHNVLYKMKSSCHYNQTHALKIKDPTYLKRMMSGEVDLKGRWPVVVPIDESYPKYVVNNLKKFEHMIKEDGDVQADEAGEKGHLYGKAEVGE